MNEFEFLDRIRAIAQLGLTYATDPYDRARYEELLGLAGDRYEAVSGLASAEVLARFRREVGYVTPKVGVDGAVFAEGGQALLVIRRRDSGAWALPGGWADLGETPEESVARELREETGLAVDPGPVIAVSSQLPGPAHPHTSIHVLYHCTPAGGTPHATAEATEVRYRDPRGVDDWHGDHGRWAARAMAWRHGQPLD